MDKRTEQLAEIRVKMEDLAEADNPSPQDVFVGLLLTIMWLAEYQPLDIKHLASAIHGDAQTAWRKANPLGEPLEED